MAEITDLEVKQLNKMNKAAQNVELGNIIKEVAGSGTFIPAEPVADLASDANVATVVTTVNSLLASLRTAGILKS